MQDGKVSLPYKQFLGYEKGEDGLPKIVESEAATVRLIFRLFMESRTPSAIVKFLAEHGILSPAGKERWQVATVLSILRNEKYKGDALLQKHYTVDFLTKKRKVNEGEIPQYYVQNSHPAIIEPDEFDAVQDELERRGKLGRPLSCNSPFSAKIVCGDCGGWFGSKVWGSNTKYRRTIWQCNDKYKGERKCETPHVTEEEIKERFLAAWNGISANREALISDCRDARAVLCDCTAIDAELRELGREVDVVTELSRKAIFENARTAMDQREFLVRNDALLERHRVATERMTALEEAKRQRQNKARSLGNFIKKLESSPQVVTAFDESLWLAAVEQVTVTLDGELVFHWKDGTESVE